MSKYLTYAPYFDDMEKKKLYNPDKYSLWCFNGPRNIGKSTDLWNIAIRDHMTADKQIVYMRRKKEQLDSFKATFDSKWAGKFKMTGKKIYSLKLVETQKKDGTLQTHYANDEIIGFCIPLSTSVNFKSGEFDKVSLVIFDEYNEDSNLKDVYTKFMTIITTIVRTRNVMLIMVGNRETANDEFMVSWAIEPEDDYSDDHITNFGANFFFVEIGNKKYQWKENKDTMFYKLAQYNPTTRAYAAGKYKFDFTLSVRNFRKIIMPTWKPTFSFSYAGIYYTHGKYIYHKDKKEYFAIVGKVHYYNSNSPYYSFDSKGDISTGSIIMSKWERKEYSENFHHKFKNGTLHFDTFETRQMIESMVLGFSG